MSRIIPAISAGILLVTTAACSPSGQAISGVAGNLAGSVIGSAAMSQPVAALPANSQTATTAATGKPTEPDYGSQKPHDHCGNGTMVHLGSVICSP